MVIKIGRVQCLIVVFAVTVFGTVTLSGTALAFPCSPPKSAAKASLELQLGDPNYIYDLDTAGIRKVVNDIQGYVAGPWHLPLGLTVAGLGMGFETQFFVRKSQEAGYCVALAEAKVTVGYRDLTVYISSNYAEGTCEFDAILAHEQEHLQINQGVLNDYKAKFRAMLRRVRRGKKVIFVHRKSAARSAYILHLRRQFKPLVAEMKAVLARKNGAIDTKENYRRVLAQCNDWLGSDLQAAGSATGSRQTGVDDPVEPDQAAPADQVEDVSAYDAYQRGDYAAAYWEWLPLAEEGDAEAQFNLGILYDLGQGVAQNKMMAAAWYRRSAEQGFAAAQYNLAIIFKNGEGVPQNNVLAYALFDLAADDDPDAAEQRDSMARRIAAAEIDRAVRLAERAREDDTAMFLGEMLGAASPAAPGPESESAGSSPELVWAVQEALTALGYDAGAADGRIGPRTRAAVRAFQADTEFGVDGQVSEQLLRRLQTALD